jgi:hypothetical protein
MFIAFHTSIRICCSFIFPQHFKCLSDVPDGEGVTKQIGYQRQYQGIFDACKKIFSHEGVRGIQAGRSENTNYLHPRFFHHISSFWFI